MAIDRNEEFWTRNNTEDLIEYLNFRLDNLKQSTSREISKTALVKCDRCGSDTFTFQIDDDEEVIKVTCIHCKRERFLFDSEEYWETCKPKKAKCHICKKNEFNLAVGFVYCDESGNAEWFYLVNQCISCGVLDNSSHTARAFHTPGQQS